MNTCHKCGCAHFRRGPYGIRICTGCGVEVNVFFKIKPYGGVVGIDGRGFVYGGYDSQETSADNSDKHEDEVNAVSFFEDQLPKEDRIELANRMIRRWSMYKSRVR